MLLVLVDRSIEPSLGPDVVAALAGLGVSSAAILADDRTVAVVLEGWAFDPVRSEEAAVTALVGSLRGVRTLQQIAHVGVTQDAGRIPSGSLGDRGAVLRGVQEQARKSER